MGTVTEIEYDDRTGGAFSRTNAVRYATDNGLMFLDESTVLKEARDG